MRKYFREIFEFVWSLLVVVKSIFIFCLNPSIGLVDKSLFENESCILKIKSLWWIFATFSQTFYICFHWFCIFRKILSFSRIIFSQNFCIIFFAKFSYYFFLEIFALLYAKFSHFFANFLHFLFRGISHFFAKQIEEKFPIFRERTKCENEAKRFFLFDRNPMLYDTKQIFCFSLISNVLYILYVIFIMIKKFRKIKTIGIEVRFKFVYRTFQFYNLFFISIFLPLYIFISIDQRFKPRL